MSIPNHLAKIKSAGVYRFVWDKSIISPAVAETLRLVVGYSEKGPFNTPVYIEKASDFYAIFGNVSKKLERKGIYFHRLALQALASGPILALNLKPFSDEKVDWSAFNPAEILKEIDINQKSISELYDTNRFWHLDADQLPKKLGSKKYINIAHTDTLDRSCSLIMRPVSPSEYNITIREWYSTVTAEEMPAYLEPIQDELVSKYFVDIYVFRGEFTYDLVKHGGPLGNYITEYSDTGEIAGQKWNGYFETVGADANKINIGDKEYVYAGVVNFPVYSVNSEGKFIANPGYKWKNGKEFAFSITRNPELASTVEKEYDLVPTLTIEDKDYYIKGELAYNDSVRYLWFNEVDRKTYYTESLDSTMAGLVTFNPNGVISQWYDADTACVSNLEEIKSTWVECDNNSTAKDFHINPKFTNSYGEELDAIESLASDSASNFIQSYRGCLIPYFKDGFGNYVSIDVQFNLGHDLHNMLMKLDETILDDISSSLEDISVKKQNIEKVIYCKDVYKTTKIYQDIEGVPVEDLDNTDLYGEKLTYIPDPNDENAPLNCVVNGIPYVLVTKEAGDIKLRPSYLKGYTYKTISNADTGIKLQNKILRVLEDKGIRTALTNRVDVDYHYIIDTFQSYITAGCKAKLSLLAKEKDNAFAILNCPPINEFINSGLFNSKNKFDISKIANARYGFSLPSENEGASHCGFFTGLNFSDGTLKYTIPSAAIVSNNFMKKYDGSLKPYHIIAGPIRGLISYSGLIGPDYNYGRSDLDVLEPLGINAIIYVPRKGVYINSNQTAKQTPVSALSKIHIRELVTYIQNEIESMLQNYQWELNTQSLRDTIKTNADYLLGRIMADGGIYAYSTICDSSNNTPEIIDNEMLVLDIAIEPARGTGKMVQQLTIHKTGGITSTAN